MSESPDATHLGLSWPEAYADILPVLRREWGVEDKIYLTRQLGGGKSGALVFFVDITTKTFTGQAILKLDRPFDPKDQEQHEAALHDRAIADAPEFAARHLPKLLYSSHHGGQVAILSTIAGRGLEYIEPWIECSYDRKLETIKKVSAGLLEDWNADYRLGSGLKMPRELLRDWLAYRLDPAQGGHIHSFLGEECGIAPETPTIIYDGHWYPNPLAFIEGGTDIPKRVRLRGVLGHCHCDFHGFNLLVGRREKRALEYYLIDLAMYQSEQFLFYDHAYFELASLLYSRGSVTGRDWEAIVAQLSRFPLKDELPELRTDDIGLIELLQALRQGITNWIERHQADRLSFMESQMLLARVAAGLNFSNKSMALDARQMAFFYAAANLKDYIKLLRLEWPKTGAAFEIGASATPLRASGESEPAAMLRAEQSSEPASKSEPESATAAPPPIISREDAAAPPSGSVFSAFRGPRALWLGGLALMAAVIALVALTGDVLRTAEKGSVPATSAEISGATQVEAGASLAVLPFQNLSGGEDDSFADGLSIDIASVFAGTGKFKMPGMTSTFKFKDRLGDFGAIGRALNVDYLLEGTVLRNGDDLRIAASLVRAEDGLLIWSSTFSEKMKDVFVTQEKIAEAIGAALSTPLDIDADVLKAQRTDDPRAYELFVRGLALLEQRGLALEDAMGVLERAVDLQPNFAAAWGALSLVYNVIPTFLQKVRGRPVSTVVYYRKAKEAALKAQAIDPDLPIVRHALAYMYQRERQWIAAEDEYKAALSNDPYAHRVMLTYAALLYTVGKRAQARELIMRAKEIDPLNELYNLWDAFMRWQSDQTEETIKPVEDIFRRLPQYREIALRIIIDHRARTGELDKVRDLIEACSGCSAGLRTRALALLDAVPLEPADELFEAYKDSNILGYQLLYAVGGADAVLDAFRYYGVDAKRRLVFFTVPWTLVNVLDQHERFLDIAEDMGLVNYWRARGYPDNCSLTNDNRFVCTENGS